MPFDHSHSIPRPVFPAIPDRAAQFEAATCEPLAAPPRLDIAYTVKGLLGGAGTVSVLRGPSNVGKSAVAVALAAHVAEGRSVADHRVRSGGILYVAAEAPGSIRMRLEPYRTRLRGRAPIHLLGLAPDLRSPRNVEALVHRVRALPAPVRLVVVDTLICAFGDGDENSAVDMHALCAGARRLAEEAGAHVMLVHHTGHLQGRMRGSSAIIAAIDTEIALEADEKVKGLVHLTTTKQRDMRTGVRLDVRLKTRSLGADADGDPVTTVLARLEAASRERSRGPEGSKKGTRKLSAAARWEALARETLCGMPVEGGTASEIARAVPAYHELCLNNQEDTVSKQIREALKRLAGRSSSGVVADRDGKRFRIATATHGT